MIPLCKTLRSGTPTAGSSKKIIEFYGINGYVSKIRGKCEMSSLNVQFIWRRNKHKKHRISLKMEEELLFWRPLFSKTVSMSFVILYHVTWLPLHIWARWFDGKRHFIVFSHHKIPPLAIHTGQVGNFRKNVPLLGAYAFSVAQWTLHLYNKN